MNLAELAEAVSTMVNDASGNGTALTDVQVVTISNRGTIKPIKGYRPYDVRSGCPVLLLEPTSPNKPEPSSE